MNFEAPKPKKSIAEKLGYLSVYLIFTLILHFFLILFNKLPDGWNFFYTLVLTFSLLIIGKVIRRIIK